MLDERWDMGKGVKGPAKEKACFLWAFKSSSTLSKINDFQTLMVTTIEQDPLFSWIFQVRTRLRGPWHYQAQKGDFQQRG